MVSKREHFEQEMKTVDDAEWDVDGKLQKNKSCNLF